MEEPWTLPISLRRPVMEVIASISMDHMAFLGDTLEKNCRTESRDHQALYKGSIRSSGTRSQESSGRKGEGTRSFPGIPGYGRSEGYSLRI